MRCFMIDQVVLKTRKTRYKLDSICMTRKDKIVLRGLALQVSSLSENKIQTERRDLWYKHNRLMHTRPLIFFDPETSWRELITSDDL